MTWYDMVLYMMWCDAMWCHVTWKDTTLHAVARRYTTLHNMAPHDTALYDMTWCDVILVLLISCHGHTHIVYIYRHIHIQYTYIYIYYVRHLHFTTIFRNANQASSAASSLEFNHPPFSQRGYAGLLGHRLPEMILFAFIYLFCLLANDQSRPMVRLHDLEIATCQQWLAVSETRFLGRI